MDYKLIFDNTPEAMVLLDPDMKIVGANKRYLEVTMRQLDNILGKHFLLEAYPEPNVPYEDNPVRLSIEEAIRKGRKVYLDVIRYAIARPDGSGYDERCWEASHTPILNEQGELLYVLQETKDVTEREETKKALQDIEQKFRFMADSMPQLIDADDAAGDSTYFNKQWEAYTGIATEQLMAGGWKAAIHPDDLQSASKVWQQSLEKGEASQVEIRIRDKEGDYRWYLSRYLPMRNEDGEIRMWLGSCSDIHDMKNLVQELLASNEQMSELADQVQLAFRKVENERMTLERLIMQAPTFFAILKGKEHRYELVNTKYQELFPHVTLIGKTVAEALPEIADQGYIDVLNNVYQTGETFEAREIVVKLSTPEGKLEDNYLTFIFQPLFDEHTQIIGILVAGFNVTDKYQMKKKLQELGIAVGEL
ncbi:PAS domain-containing protein [Pontibacter sp. HSC-36F09]|uniref:PAS domain-containing protein n=1 Tax=Pontibacter sp. HSC-36F09 TaxID=2910966 RepID=UPI0020A032C6|nr:PAS domain-containing protein [Pontibacter sp. HSC-36F09]MCP2045255.1 PAS domain S-box-containing protein [Pontibacter sp. HSC-36F09]